MKKISDLKELKNNIKRCDFILNEINQKNANIIPHVHVWCVLKEKNKYYLGFSKFVGFKNQSFESYFKTFFTNDGRDSNKAIYNLCKKYNSPKLCEIKEVNKVKDFLGARLDNLGKKRNKKSYIVFIEGNEIFWKIEGELESGVVVCNNSLIDIMQIDFSKDKCKSVEEVNKNNCKDKSLIKREHNEIQNKVYSFLKEKYGNNNSIMESNGIDILRKSNNNAVVIYEVKPFENFILIIREALGQIIEYGYYKKFKYGVKKLIIVGKVKPSKSELNYWREIKSNTKYPLYYQWFNENKLEGEI